MTATATIIFLVWALAAALLLSDLRHSTGFFPPKIHSPYGLLSLFPALASFLFIAPGCLPPLCNSAWGAIALLACLFCSLVLEKQYRTLMPLCLAGLACAGIFCFAWYRGMPGSPLNLGSFAAMPVWQVATWPERPALFLLAVGFGTAVRWFAIQEATAAPLVSTLRLMALCAVFVSFFLSWSVAPYLSWPDTLVASVDFIFFWGKVVACMYCIPSLPCPSAAMPLSFFCSATGLALVLCQIA